MKNAWRVVGVAGALGLAACGENVVGAIPDAGVSAAVDAGIGTYPPGPYGNNPGDTLINMIFDGYVNDVPTEGPVQGGPFERNFTLQDIRDLESARFLLLNVAAEWCMGCRVEAEQLPGLYETWAPRGGYILSVMIEDTAGNPATRLILERWLASFSLNYTMVHDPQMFITRELGPDTLPLNLLVDLEDMRIVDSVVGEDPAVFDTFANLLETP